MIVDGTRIAEEILLGLKEDIEARNITPRLSVITCNPNFETQKFLSLKKRKAEEIGVHLNVIELPEEVTVEMCRVTIAEAAKHADGIVVQLPFPHTIDAKALIAAIPTSHDVDAFNEIQTRVHPPVVGAIEEILKRHAVQFIGKKVAVVGDGALVGAPAARFFKKEGCTVDVVTKDTKNMSEVIEQADIVVLGAGVPALIKKEMISPGAVVLDAGTSEDAGELKGDADPKCADVASLLTPVPGGIGPITIAILLRNTLTLMDHGTHG